VQSFPENGITMQLFQSLPLSPATAARWESVTAVQIRNEAYTMIGATNDVETVEILVNLASQNPSPPGRRRLQAGVPGPLELVFDAEMLIRTNATDIQLPPIVEGAFDDSGKIQDYVAKLRLIGGNGGSELSDAVYDQVTFPSTTVIPPATTSDNNPLSNPGVIVGIALVAISGLALVGFFVYTRRKRKQQNQHQKDDSKPPVTHIGAPSHDYASEIELDMRGDVSTLGDPIPPGLHLSAPPTGTSVADSFTLDYDFQKAYRGAAGAPSIADGSNDSTNPNIIVPKDDETLDAQYFAEDQFEVEAPSGMLGLVLETSADGVPTVHAIKNTSALASEVQVGDRLLSVDGEDVTVMLASDVSRLIATKRDNPVRRFVFARPPKKGGTHDLPR